MNSTIIIPVYLVWRVRGTIAESPRGPTVIASVLDGMRAGKSMAVVALLLAC